MSALVACMDQAFPDRIRCISVYVLTEIIPETKRAAAMTNSDVMKNAILARACPYHWGDAIDEVMSCLNESEMFDVIVEADCCYMLYVITAAEPRTYFDR